jgi:NagD protein
LSYFIDVQGTLIDDKEKKPIKGAIEFIDKLNEKKTPYVVVTNNTKQKSDDFYQFLLDLDFCIPKQNYLDPFMVLKNSLHVKSIYGFGPTEFLKVLDTLEYAHSQNPDAILIASSMEFNSDDYALMIEKVFDGAKIVGMHATSLYAKNGKRYPGVGAILQMLHFATGKDFFVIGKPSEAFYQEALRLLNEQQKGLCFADVTMISDDATGDLCGIKTLGAKTVLVLSGKCKNENEVLHVKDSLDKIVSNIAEIEV